VQIIDHIMNCCVQDVTALLGSLYLRIRTSRPVKMV